MKKFQIAPSQVRTVSLHVAALYIFTCASSSAAQVFKEDNALEEVVVRAHPLSGEGLAQPFVTIDGDQLRRAQATSIGETLSLLPSIHTTSFGQAVGRPVIRGLAGARVKVMKDRIDTLDVSVSSPDHTPTIDAFSAQSIEVLMGPSTLIYGSGALGGVVDVHTGRIPHSVPETTAARLELRGADNGNRRTAAGRVDTGAGNFSIHVDGFYREADDYDIPGFAESRRLRALEQSGSEHEESHDTDHEAGHDDDHGKAEEYVKGTLPGSFLETYGGAVGASYVGESGFLGLALSSYQSNYGLPGHSHGHGHHEDEVEHESHGEDDAGEQQHDGDHEGDEGSAVLDLEQTRVDLEWGYSSSLALLESMNLRVGYNDYEHVEFEPDGGRGTTFSAKAHEARFEVVHSELANLEGSAGLQLSQREFSALGEEAFVEPVDTNSVGLFYVGQTRWRGIGIEGGLRGDHVEHDPDTSNARDFNLVSGSLGLLHSIGESWQLTGQLDYSSRAPTAIELFSNGPHLATQSFEIGDPDLIEEKAVNISVGVNYQSQRLLLAMNVYQTSFDDFIYETATGEERDELPVLQWQQDDATLYGADARIRWEAARWRQGTVLLDASADTVRAKLDANEKSYLPRIPPMRWSLGATVNWGSLVAQLNYTRVAEQGDTAPQELTTDAYDDVSLQLVYSLPFETTRVEFFLNGSNLTDDEQRLHTSFIKDLAPQPGRTLEAGVRVQL